MTATHKYRKVLIVLILLTILYLIFSVFRVYADNKASEVWLECFDSAETPWFNYIIDQCGPGLFAEDVRDEREICMNELKQSQEYLTLYNAMEQTKVLCKRERNEDMFFSFFVPVGLYDFLDELFY